MLPEYLFLFMIFSFSCFLLLTFAEAKLPQEEVDVLQEITSTLGATYWKLDGDSCEIQTVGVTLEPPRNSESSIGCDCHFENNTVCHVLPKVTIQFAMYYRVLKGYSLPGMLPPQLVKLHYLREISVLVNRLSGGIPKELGNITTLTYLSLEANQFSGTLPPELGNLVNLQTLILSSNNLTGSLPTTFARLRNLTDFRINDNNFGGQLPEFVQYWKLLTRLRISDINGSYQDFPVLRNISGIVRLVLRNCKISGEIPAYIWTMKNLEMFLEKSTIYADKGA
ncbi:putative LRR receptor-like serine/threonine-protein kinase RFK1 [Morella rubra]|uniref:Putative LRR receptor-like serine/threonine-protein kinase RFK1 n=1 Tax=Morella rubra TaxID=262757 RepID=A0A6A1WC72_9ROSI|nr:putative LRR receptor-like serine/threonine-protein kinase RFK1 [Morella rubra]KAB1221558.1 putative LRR receptor-like serine/threonine-protein kinase RFK1 [Morella rubra]